jgi:hypothetical protein
MVRSPSVIGDDRFAVGVGDDFAGFVAQEFLSTASELLALGFRCSERGLGALSDHAKAKQDRG